MEVMERAKEVVTGSENEEEDHVDRLPAELGHPVRVGLWLMPREREPQTEVDATGL